ncbi:transposase [Aminirod propionatiphilus]|uniref:Transposase n=1 Tax=Aminirod propionatiphilus TaxID=3415223 RepID=A0ACD1DUG3_9BACT|nr:transposase [Synergistota bacterium]
MLLEADAIGQAGRYERSPERLDEVLGVCEGDREDGESRSSFLRYLEERGLGEICLVTSDKSLGLLETLPRFFPEARWQRCVVPFYRNVYSAVPRGKAREVALMLEAIHSQEDLPVAREKVEAVVEKLEAMKLRKAATIVKDGCEETLSHFHFPSEQRKRLRTDNALERLNREIRRRTKVAGNFPDGESALMLVSARVRHVASTQWGKRSLPEHGTLAGTGPGTTAGNCCDLKKIRHSPSGACCPRTKSAKNTE